MIAQVELLIKREIYNLFNFNICVDGNKVTTEIACIDVYEPKNFEKVFDLDALCNAISESVKNLLEEIDQHEIEETSYY